MINFFASLLLLLTLLAGPATTCTFAEPAKMSGKKLYSRFAEIGRVVLINYGPDAGKLATIVDIIDHSQALIDGPANITGVGRQVINFKWLQLTDLKANGKKEGKTVAIARNARQKSLTKVWGELDLLNKFNKSAWGKKIAAKAAKAASSDFDRFKAKKAKQAIAKKIKA